MSFLVSLFELAKPISTIKSFNDNLPSVKLTLINGRFSDEPSFLKTSLAVFSAKFAFSFPCSISVAALANKIFTLLILVSFSSNLISSKVLSVKSFKNLNTSRSSTFLQNCQ